MRSDRISDFTGFAVRRWRADQYVADDPSAGELLSLHGAAEEAATTAWRLRSIAGAFSFGVIRVVSGERQPLRLGRDHGPIVSTYTDLENERNRRRPLLPGFAPSGAAA